MRRSRMVLTAFLLIAIGVAVIWQLGARYSAGPTLRHPPAAGAKADSSFFANH